MSPRENFAETSRLSTARQIMEEDPVTAGPLNQA
jgi:hypothetical protein